MGGGGGGWRVLRVCALLVLVVEPVVAVPSPALTTTAPSPAGAGHNQDEVGEWGARVRGRVLTPKSVLAGLCTQQDISPADLVQASTDIAAHRLAKVGSGAGSGGVIGYTLRALQDTTAVHESDGACLWRVANATLSAVPSLLALALNPSLSSRVPHSKPRAHGTRPLAQQDSEPEYLTPWGGLAVASPRRSNDLYAIAVFRYTVMGLQAVGVLLLLFTLFRYWYNSRWSPNAMMRMVARRDLADAADPGWQVNKGSKTWNKLRYLAVAQGGEEYDDIIARLRRQLSDTHGSTSPTMVVNHATQFPTPIADDEETLQAFEGEVRRLAPTDALAAMKELRRHRKHAQGMLERIQASGGDEAEQLETSLTQLQQQGEANKRWELLGTVHAVGLSVRPLGGDIEDRLRAMVENAGSDGNDSLQATTKRITTILSSLPSCTVVIANTNTAIDLLNTALQHSLDNAGDGLLRGQRLHPDQDVEAPLDDRRFDVLLGRFRADSADIQDIPFGQLMPGHVLELAQTNLAQDVSYARSVVSVVVLTVLLAFIQAASSRVQANLSDIQAMLELPCEQRDPNSVRKYLSWFYAPPACPVDGTASRKGDKIVYQCSNTLSHPSCQGGCYLANPPERQILRSRLERQLLFPENAMPESCRLADVQRVVPYNLLEHRFHHFNPAHPEFSLQSPATLFILGRATFNFQISLRAPLSKLSVPPIVFPSVSDPYADIDNTAAFVEFRVGMMDRSVEAVVAGADAVRSTVAVPYAAEGAVRAACEKFVCSVDPGSNGGQTFSIAITATSGGFKVSINGADVLDISTPPAPVHVVAVSSSLNVAHSSLHPCGVCEAGQFCKGGGCMPCPTECPPNFFRFGCVGGNEGECVRCYDCPIGQQRVGCGNGDVGTCEPLPGFAAH